MTQEEKELLLKDLSARLPYGIIVAYKNQENKDGCVKLGYGNIGYVDELGRGWWTVCKPYLRSMSSMTEEEKELLKEEHIKDEQLYINCIEKSKIGDNSMRGKVIPHFAADWCNKNHFDYRGLISMELALEATEKMYKS